MPEQGASYEEKIQYLYTLYSVLSRPESKYSITTKLIVEKRKERRGEERRVNQINLLFLYLFPRCRYYDNK